jgi:CRP-like cAMP-binding protein
VSVTRASSEGEIELMRAGPGDHFGEIGLLTKAASQVTLKALTPVSTYELAKEHLAPLIALRPDFSDELGHVLAQHQAIGRLVATEEIDKACLRATRRPGSQIGYTAWSTSPTPNERAIRLESTRSRPRRRKQWEVAMMKLRAPADRLASCPPSPLAAQGPRVV